MGDFVVSALKYRPDTFDTVVGQESITSTLRNAIRNEKLAQAFLFCGPRGVGKTTCARILARTVNCRNLDEKVEPCGNCDSCRSYAEGHSLNIHELDAASNNTVDDIRNLIDQVRLAPQMGSKKVYIIDEVHMLSQSAFNAFLKTLEEPPEHAIFILATTEKHKVLPTILSRCQIFDFNRIGIREIADHLERIAEKEGIEAEREGLNMISQKAEGALRDALSIFDQIVSFSGGRITYRDVVDNLNILDHDLFFRVTDAIQEGDVASCMLILDEVLQSGFEDRNFITGLAQHFRDILVCKNDRTAELLEIGDRIGERYQQAAGELDASTLTKGLERLNECDVQYKSSKNTRLLVELTLMQLCGNAENAFDKGGGTSGSGGRSKDERPKTASQGGRSSTREDTGARPGSQGPIQDAGEAPEHKASTIPEQKASSPDQSSAQASKEAEEETVQPGSEESVPEGPEKEEESSPVEGGGGETTTSGHGTDKQGGDGRSASDNTQEKRNDGGMVGDNEMEGAQGKKRSTTPVGKSIKDFTQNAGDPVAEKDPEGGEKTAQEAGVLKGLKEDPFTADQLLKAWNDYAEGIRETDRSLYTTLTKNPPELLEDHQVALLVDNQVQIRRLDKNKRELLAYLRETLQNDHIDIVPRIDEKGENKKVYTDREKFNYMAELNPTLEEFKKRFNLDIEF